MDLFKSLRQKETTKGALSDKDKLDWLRLARSQRIGPVTFYKLLEVHGSPSRALEALPEMASKGGKSIPKLAPMDKVKKEYDLLRKAGGNLIAACEDAYPKQLAQCEDAPPIISVLGNTELLNKPCVGIVGARNASIHARRLTWKIAKDLCEAGFTVSSGLARGIDTAAHEGSINGGTIAVVAGGIDVVYPSENVKLYDDIAKKGVIVAESPLGQKPFSQSFPRRNRIISGLSKGVVVIECAMKSGSLITARLAGEQGRDVMAVPSFPTDPRSQGPNYLIRQGATLVRCAQDVLEVINGDMIPVRIDPKPKQEVLKIENVQEAKPPCAPDDLRKALQEHLSVTPVDIDSLIRALDAPAPIVQTALLEMELAGRIERLAGGKVALIESEQQ